MTQSIQDFFAAWGQQSEDDRALLLERAISDKGYAYHDPKSPAAVTSVADMAGMLANFPPGAGAKLIGDVDITHTFARATVNFDFGGGQSMVAQYYFDLDGEKCILRAVGFPGPGGQ